MFDKYWQKSNFLRNVCVPFTLSWRSPYHIETSPLMCSANQWAGFFKIGISVMKELITEIQKFTA